MALCNVVCVLSMDPDTVFGFVPALSAAVVVGILCGALRNPDYERASGTDYRYNSYHGGF